MEQTVRIWTLNDEIAALNERAGSFAERIIALLGLRR